MMRTHDVLRVSFVLLAAAACGQDGPRGDPLTGGPPRSVETPGMAGLPHGHPPVPDTPPGPVRPTAPSGVKPEMPPGHPPVPEAGPAPKPAESSFVWIVPAGWTATTPSSRMRIAQFELPAKWPDGVAVVCAVFGGIGGGRQANIDRWIGQFEQTDGSESKSKAKLAETVRDGLTVTRIELTGRFSDGMVQPPRQTDDGMLLGGIVESADGDSVYVKLTGPREAVAAQAQAFDALLASFAKK